jgi:DNA protecting protein DprA
MRRPAGIPAPLWDGLLGYSLAQGAERVAEAQEKGMRLIAWGSPDYPPLLAASGYTPPVFWLKGRLPSPGLPSLAMVGTRTPSKHAGAVCDTLLRSLPQTLIVSGLALGIDSLCHAGALRHKHPTVAVLAQGLDTPIEGSRGELAQAILEAGGALLSVFPPGTPVSKSSLVQRNHAIAGLAQATLLVESRETGGAMHTAHFCLEEGRPLYAIPGDPWRETAQGGNRLIEQGKAKPMWNLDGTGGNATTMTIDDFAKKMQKTIPEILPLLTEWELEGKAKIRDGFWVEIMSSPPLAT